MAEESAHTETTEAPKTEGGFPPFDTTTFPSQFFWLAITFAFLFTVLWRVAGPRINGAITNRRGVINGAIAEAGKARGDAEVAGARARANALAEDTRSKLNAEIAKAKAEADAKAHDAMLAADTRIAQTRENAKAAVTVAARDAAIAIVERLTGDKVSADDAAKALGN
jgi:F-type H+-transporting ATPase subunit b